ncbi:hypothetical protein [Hymenobacter jeollabukensis]|uniref:DUF1735 domain-containing protein n=1 Tax=Hymenobacter jeollabukensis TaxID=2025313 RepID=A0A5R8WUB5_9BACT|nr:hypothetical protein [Hymenobacter jeollabukensis]TLM95046.1 hypothetical protein FDY95_04395 [Hymenobacter jeollabukensis]
MQTLRLALLAASLLVGAASCDSKSDDPQPEAPAVARHEMNRVFYYPSNATSAGISYAPADVKASGRLTADQLLLSFEPEAGQDAVSFTLPIARLTAGLTGTYALQSLPTPASAIAQVAYTFTANRSAAGSNGRLFLSNANYMDGQVVITAYDQQRRLLSGSYTLKMNDIIDPFSSAMSSPPALRCNLTLNGSFENLPLQ